MVVQGSVRVCPVCRKNQLIEPVELNPICTLCRENNKKESVLDGSYLK
jgi:hypothetical protein